MAINFPEKFKKELADGFKKRLFTEGMMSHDIDQEFSGVKTVHETQILPEPMEDYDRTQSPATGSRYGTVKEVQDAVATYTMEQDKSFTLSVDKGNNKEQLDMKKVGAVMKVQRDEVINPFIDKYRLKRWAELSGMKVVLTAALSTSNIVKAIVDAHNEMLEHQVPEDGATLVVTRKYMPTLKLANEWVALDSLGGKTLPSGALGMFDNMSVFAVPTRLMPKDVAFLIIHKNAVLSPVKIHEFKGHVDPPGLSGDLIEFRLLFDAFVRAPKCMGVLAAIEPGKAVATPTFSASGNSVTVTVASGATAKYTVDGSDPRFSNSAAVYSSAVTVPSGKTLKVYASKSGLYDSPLAEYEMG